MSLIYATLNPTHQQSTETADNQIFSTFVDDNYVKVLKPENKSLQEEVYKTMEKIKIYMDSNKLALNSDKSKIIIISKNNKTKENFQVTLQGKLIKHSPNVKILGTTLNQNLTWEQHMTKELIPDIKNRIRTLKTISKFLDNKFKRNFANAIYRGKVTLRH